MKRIFAFLIDYMILLAVLMGPVFLAINSGIWTGGSLSRIGLPAAMAVCLVYFFSADYWFQGITLGKRFLGLRLIWDQGEGNTRLVRSILHTVFKCLLIIVWPATLILYLCLGGRMPYDIHLGLCYVQGPKAPLWKTLLKIAAGVVIFFALVFSAASLMLSSVNKEAYYTVRDEKIPSVYTVLGKHRLAGYSSSSSSGVYEAQYQYVVRGNGNELLEQYMEYLIQNEGFARHEEDESGYRGNVRVLKRQARDGYETTAFLVSSRDALTVKLVCAQAEN